LLEIVFNEVRSVLDTVRATVESQIQEKVEDETDDLNTEDQVGMPTGLAHVNFAGGGSHEEGSKDERIGLSDFDELKVL
jgi:hypothetical protein